MTQFKSAALGLALILGMVSIAQGASSQMMAMSMHDNKMVSSCMAMSGDAMMNAAMARCSCHRLDPPCEGVRRGDQTDRDRPIRAIVVSRTCAVKD